MPGWWEPSSAMQTAMGITPATVWSITRAGWLPAGRSRDSAPAGGRSLQAQRDRESEAMPMGGLKHPLCNHSSCNCPLQSVSPRAIVPAPEKLQLWICKSLGIFFRRLPRPPFFEQSPIKAPPGAIVGRSRRYCFFIIRQKIKPNRSRVAKRSGFVLVKHPEEVPNTTLVHSVRQLTACSR